MFSLREAQPHAENKEDFCGGAASPHPNPLPKGEGNNNTDKTGRSKR